MKAWMKIGCAAAAALLAGCTIADVTVPPSEDRLVIEAVLRTDREQQIILLHRSVQGNASGEASDAEVVVTTELGQRVVFSPNAGRCFEMDPVYLQYDSLRVHASCYVSAPEDGNWVVPGQTYDLTVRTPQGEEARSRTTTPGAFRVHGIRTASAPFELAPVCRLQPNTPLVVSWSPSPGAWGYLAPLTLFGLSRTLPSSLNPPDPMELVGLAITARDTQLVLPAEFGVFERFQYNQELLRALQGGLPAGTMAQVVIAAADRNYINGVRGGNFNPSGQVRISSIVGDGVGVFGSLTPLTFEVDVGGSPAALFCAGS